MGFLDRLSNRRVIADAPAPDDSFGDGLDEHAHLVVARWGDAQRAEYLRYGLPVVLACRAVDEGRFADASRTFESLADASTGAVFLHRDAGRARLFLGDREGAETHFVRFLDASVASATARERFEAYLDLASIADARGEIDRAIDWLSAPLDADVPEPSAYVALGHYLRTRGFVDEARAVLEARFEEGGVLSSELLEELGHCRYAVGDLGGTEQVLGEVVRRAKCSCGARIPESVAATLASVYEASGRNVLAEELRRSVGSACRTH